MSTSYYAKNDLQMRNQLKYQQLTLPFKIVGNATPSSVVISQDDPSILYLKTQGVDQITAALSSGETAPTYAAPNDASGIFNILVRVQEPIVRVAYAYISSRNQVGEGMPPGSPNLATASSYGLLSHSTITNTGSSVITGNLGLYPGTSVTGFPPGTVSGVENIANAAAQQAEIDAGNAYVYLASLPATSIPADLDGQTLTPGTYKEASGTFNLATSGNATLTLNGNGVYVFQCSSTLVTGAGGIPTIALTGGALASNVYWICGSSATLNVSASGVFQGTVIATASVTLDGGSVNGRAIALNGSVTISAATNVTVIPGSACNAIPVACTLPSAPSNGITAGTGVYSGQDIALNANCGCNFSSITEDSTLTIVYQVKE